MRVSAVHLIRVLSPCEEIGEECQTHFQWANANDGYPLAGRLAGYAEPSR